MNFLATMAASSAQRVAAARLCQPIEELRAYVRDLPPPPRWVPSREGFDLIAEVKWRSPAAGMLRPASSADLDARVASYAQAGAAAISVLTEPSRFDGSLDHLRAVVTSLSMRGTSPPVMRKDFLVDPYQLLEARASGAGGVLLIVRMLDAGTLASLIEGAREQQLFVLLEVFDEVDVEQALTVLEPRRSALDDQVLIGVNCRDLSTLQVVPSRLESMIRHLPREFPRVAESGVSTPEDARRLAAVGYDAALVGSALMSAGHPQELAQALLRSGRSARSGG